MADHWLKSLGGKLMKTGVAYLQQVRLVQELKALPVAQARDRFQAFVMGLSPAARAGFGLTLASLLNNEANPQSRRFLEMLRAALNDPAAWSSGDPPPGLSAPAQQLKTSTRGAMTNDDHLPSLDEDLHRLDDWDRLEEREKPLALQRYVAQLSEAGIQNFCDNMDQALRNIAQNIADHRENEARIAAGRYFEDQSSYRMSRLAGAPPDPDWLAGLRNYERHQRHFEAIRDYLVQALEERRRPPPPPKAPEKKEHTADPTQVQALQQMLKQELAAGRVAPERAPALAGLLDKLGGIMAANAKGKLKAHEAESRTQELMADLMPFLANPGMASAKATPRGKEVLRHAGALKVAVLREVKESPQSSSAQALGAVLSDLTQVQTEAAKARDDDTLAKIEATLLRPAARNWHDFVLTRHALLARPHWQANSVTRSVNTLFYSGAIDLLPLVEGVAAGKGLEVEASRRVQHPGQARWDRLNECHVALFDLRRAPEMRQDLATRSPRRARELTGTAYELGLALALGKPIVVLATPGEQPPFDIDLSPLWIDNSDDDAPALALALDEAFYVAQRESRANAMGQTLAALDSLTQEHPKRAQIEGMGWLDPALQKDPAGFADAMRHTLRTLEDPQLLLLRPSWPGAYAEADAARCFHVMPYGPDWAEGTCEAAREACRDLGIDYRVGKEAEDGCIVRAIWDDLCRASIVLVELHGCNLNVMIELGMAHALGRPVLAIQHTGAPDMRPPHIEKLRVHYYDTAAQLKEILLQRLRV